MGLSVKGIDRVTKFGEVVARWAGQDMRSRM